MHQMRQMQVQQKQMKSAQARQMVVFDWDDTLFPTHEMKKEQPAEMNEVGEKVFIALTVYCATFGRRNVFIVTNALNGWVQEIATQTAKEMEKRYPLAINWWQLICSSFICPDDTSALC